MTLRPSKRTSPIDEIVGEHLHPLLAPLGFKRRRKAWNRRAGTIVQVIDLQAAKSNSSERSDFTINIGVFSARVFEAVWQRSTPEFVKGTDCTLRLRIGDLQEGGELAVLKDTWWCIDDTHALDEVGKDVVAAVKSKAVPFLNRVQSDESILEMMGKIGGWPRKFALNQIYLAALNAETGKTTIAAQLLDDASKNQAWQERALAVRRFYNLG
jgi:hypothetical protein